MRNLLLIVVLFIASCSAGNEDQKACIANLKSNLNDAASFELVEFYPVDSTWNTGTAAKPVVNKAGEGDLFHIEYWMKYRAKNAMGAMVLGAHQFFVEQKNHTVMSSGKLD
jgi:hypothetical protein